VRNPRTDVTACGYGYSETEMLIRVVTHILNAVTYNGGFFDKNSIPRGILNIFGNFTQEDIQSFKRQWNAMQRGVQNAHNLPVMMSKDTESAANYTEIGGQIQDLAFGKWLSFLTSIACAIYGVSPEEISMESFATSSNGLGGNDTEEKLVSSNDKGLRPLLSYYEGIISDFLIQTFNPNFMFRFAGLDAEDEKNRFELQKLVTTWNEGRSLVGLDAVEGPLGDAPLNTALLAAWQQENGVGLPEEPQEDFGDPDAADAAEGGHGGPPGAHGDDAGGDSGRPDFGSPEPGDEATVAKAISGADFGFPAIYVIES
jgi:hypothetical protein